MVEQCCVHLAVLCRRIPTIRNRVLACHVLNPDNVYATNTFVISSYKTRQPACIHRWSGVQFSERSVPIIGAPSLASWQQGASVCVHVPLKYVPDDDVTCTLLTGQGPCCHGCRPNEAFGRVYQNDRRAFHAAR